MKNINIFILVSITFLSPISCNRIKETVLEVDRTGGESFSLFDSKNVVSQKDALPYVTDITVIKIPSKDTLIVSGANKIIPFGKNIIFCDKRISFVYLINTFSSKIRAVGGFGSQMGQYLSTEDVNYDKFNDEIQILSNEKGSLIRFDSNGKFKSESKLDFFASGFKNINKNTIAFFVNQNKSDISENFNLLFTDLTGKVKKKAFDFTYLPKASYLYTGGFSSDDKSLFTMPFSDSLYQISDNKAKLKYTFLLGNNALPYNLILNSDAFKLTRLTYTFLETPYLDGDNYLQIYYNHKRMAGSSIFNKKSKKTFNSIIFKDTFPLNCFLMNVCAVDGDYFYAYMNMSSVFTILNSDRNSWEKVRKFNKSLYSILVSAKPTDNPILIRYKYSF